MIKSYYNDYPDLIDDRVYTSQDQLKTVIKQFDTAMIESGLVRSSDNGQLDTNNIEDLDILNSLGVNTSNSQYYRVNGTYVSYKPLIYCFTDTLQSTKPVYISITFEIGRTRIRSSANAPPAGTPYVFPLILAAVIRVGNNTDGNGNITNALTFYHGAIAASGDNNYNIKQTTLINYAYRNSIINYQKEKGLLSLNICPGYRFVADKSQQGWVNGNNNNLNVSLINIIVFRLNDDTIGAFGHDDVTPISESTAARNKFFKYMNGNVTYNDTSNLSVRGFFNTTQSYINGKIVTQPLNGYDPVKKLMVRYPYILMSSISETGGITGPNLSVILNENEKYNYYVYSPYDNGFVFTGNSDTQQNLLIYTGTEKYDY